MEGADIPLDVALSLVLAAAVDSGDRRGLLAALRREAGAAPGGADPVGGAARVPAQRRATPEPAAGPALVYAFPSPGPDADPDGPSAA